MSIFVQIETLWNRRNRFLYHQNFNLFLQHTHTPEARALKSGGDRLKVRGYKKRFRRFHAGPIGALRASTDGSLPPPVGSFRHHTTIGPGRRSQARERLEKTRENGTFPGGAAS